MFQYILKRLLLIAVTLFGITIITFVVTRLAPGDPAVMRLYTGSAGTGGRRVQPLDVDTIEQNRRILGLDKPVVLNWRPKGRRENILRLIERLDTPEQAVYDSRRRDFAVIGTAALPAVMEVLPVTTLPLLRRRLLRFLEDLIDQEPSEYGVLSENARIQWWQGWWNTSQSTYTPAHVKQVVDHYFAEPTDGNLQRVKSLGGCAVPFLIERIDSHNPHMVDVATSPLKYIAREEWSTWNAPDNAERRRRLDSWRRWWRYHEGEFVEFTGFARFVRIFTDTQYGVWFGKVLRFDFDESYEHHRPALELIINRLPVSLQLSLISIFLSYLISIPLGIFSATHQYRFSDKLITTILFILYSLPSFWVADMLILFLTGGEFLRLFPVQGLHSAGADNWPFWKWLLDWIWHLVLPITCLTYASFAFLSRQMRVAMLETVRQDFIRTAQAKGLSRRAVIFKHALRNSMIPILTLMASLLPELIGGSIIIEYIFGIEGMGKLTIDSIHARDYAVINAVLFFSAFLTLLGILLSDLSYALVDPRIRYE